VVRAGELTGQRGHGQFIARPHVSWAESEQS
jgi:hypothetical protein